MQSCSLTIKDSGGNTVDTLVRGQEYQGIGTLTGTWDGGCSDCGQSHEIIFTESSQAYNQVWGTREEPSIAPPVPEKHGYWTPEQQSPGGLSDDGPWTSTFNLQVIPPGNGVMQVRTDGAKNSPEIRSVVSNITEENIKNNTVASWKGEIIAGFTEQYTFKFEYTNTDKVKMIFNGQTKFNDQNVSTSAVPTQASFSVNLTAGQKYPFEITYESTKDGGRAKLFWSSLSTPLEIIPVTSLYQNGWEPALGTTNLVLALNQDLNDYQGGPECRASQQVTIAAAPSSPSPSPSTSPLILPPTVSLTADGVQDYLALATGKQINLAWSAANSPTTCTAKSKSLNLSWDGAKSPLGGSQAINLTNPSNRAFVFGITCTNAYGSGYDSVTVSINSFACFAN